MKLCIESELEKDDGSLNCQTPAYCECLEQGRSLFRPLTYLPNDGLVTGISLALFIGNHML